MVKEVFFATDRAQMPSNGCERAFFCNGRGSDKLTYGIARVSIPPGHVFGRLERPRHLWTFSLAETAEKHVVIAECKALDSEEWIGVTRGKLEARGGWSVLVFIHGYNVNFDEALRRTGQLGADLQFDGLLSCFSWASEGVAAGYMADLNNADLAAPRLAEFLQTLRRDVGAETVHVIAHSMGNRVLVKALQAISVEEAHHLKEIVMAAPDIDCAIFKAAAAGLSGKARRYTLYGSKRDIALTVSRRIRMKYPRIGDGGRRVFVTEGMDTIDASAVSGELLELNHSYAFSKRPVVTDLHYVIRTPTPAVDRAGLAPKTKNGLPYWLMRA